MDEQYFTAEVKARERSLYRIAISYMHSDADAADAVQDALLKAWEKRHTLRELAYFGTWLTRILINVCKSHLRARPRAVALVDIPDAGVQDMAEHNLVLKEALDTLDLKYRIPLLLHYLDGYPIKEVAHIMRLPVGTVKSRLSRARKLMQDRLNQEVFSDETK
ncbi:MAG: RNA polymerase sigma factor [Christensenellales bacterium]|jgi:RNA polymerase sigma-70 factor (ECF subfamily)